MFYADEESAAYPENLLPFGMKDSHIYMLASDMYPYYIEVNLSLLDEMNLPYPEADWSTIGAIAYAWQDDRECYACGSPDCPCETAWGLVRTDGSEKPVTDVFRKYAKML